MLRYRLGNKSYFFLKNVFYSQNTIQIQVSYEIVLIGIVQVLIQHSDKFSYKSENSSNCSK